MNLSSSEVLELEALMHKKGVKESKDSLMAFARFMHHDFITSGFHEKYYEILEALLMAG